MSKNASYNKAFIECFDLSEKELNSDLKYQSIKNWDSVGHMALIARLEEDFGIMLEMDDIIDFSSFEEGKLILKKYGVELDT